MTMGTTNRNNRNLAKLRERFFLDADWLPHFSRIVSVERRLTLVSSAKIFELADLLLLTEIYASSENPIPGISGQSLAQGIRQVCSTPIKYFETLDELLASLDTILKPGDVLLTQGAGSITRIGPAWLNGAFNA